jgi:hypothetical protein
MQHAAWYGPSNSCVDIRCSQDCTAFSDDVIAGGLNVKGKDHPAFMIIIDRFP